MRHRKFLQAYQAGVIKCITLITCSRINVSVLDSFNNLMDGKNTNDSMWSYKYVEIGLTEVTTDRN